MKRVIQKLNHSFRLTQIWSHFWKCVCAVCTWITGFCNIVLHILVIKLQLLPIVSIQVYMLLIILNHPKCNESMLLCFCVLFSGVYLGTERWGWFPTGFWPWRHWNHDRLSHQIEGVYGEEQHKIKWEQAAWIDVLVRIEWGPLFVCPHWLRTSYICLSIWLSFYRITKQSVITIFFMFTNVLPVR